ncbi:MAG: BatD family protein [Xanthomonadales bacterium]|nr:BatD family protein [Xanthomonadales bacterium]
MTARLLLALLFLLTLPAISAAQSISASLDRTQVFLGDTVLLRIELQNPDGDQNPDYSALKADFDLLDNGSNARVEIVNGRRSVMIEHNVLLEPRRAGRFVIPPITVGQQSTQPLELTVSPRREGAGTDQDIFIEVEALPEDPYVHAQVRLTVRLYHAPPITEGSLTPDAWPDNAVVERLGDDVTYQTKVDRRRYRVIERRYALFPESSGALQIPEIRFRGRVADASTNLNSLFSRGRRVSIRSDAITLQVRPQPADFSGDIWLPANNLEVKEVWPNGDPQFVVGEPLTRNLVTSARGLLAAQLPQFELPVVEGIKSYPDQPTSRTNVDGSWALAQREEKFALVPTRAGEITLPEVRIPWWDTEQDVEKIVVIPQRTVTVAAAADGAASVTPEQVQAVADSLLPGPAAQDNVTAGLWKPLTFAFALLWLATLALWARARRPVAAEASSPPQKQVDETRRSLKKAVAAACQGNDAKAAADSLLRWASLERDAGVHSLAALARLLVSDSQAGAIAELDRSLYRGNPDEWDGAGLARAVKGGLEFRPPETEANNEAEALPPLYPS